MTAVPPPSQPSPQTAAPAAAAPTATVPQPPVALLQMATGTVVEGTVVPAPPPPPHSETPPDPRPTVTLRTPAGDVTLRTPLPLPEGAKVAVELLRAAAHQATVRFVSIDNVPVAQALPQLTRPPPQAAPAQPLPQPPLMPAQNPLTAPVLPVGAAWTPAGPTPLTNLGLFSGLVLPPPATPTTPVTPQVAATLSPLTPGTEVSLRVTGFQLPAPGTTPPPSGMTPVPPNPLQPPSPLPQPGAMPPPATATPSPPLPQAPGVGVAPQLPGPMPAPGPTPGPVPLPAGPQPGLVLPNPQGWPAPAPIPPVTVQPAPVQLALTGVVTASPQTGAPVVQTDAGTIQLNARANVPAGATVTLEITAQMPPRPDAPAPLPALNALPLTGTAGWPTLAESLLLLQRADPQAAAQLSAAIPDGGPRTAAAAMSFAQALRTGDSRQWPGDASLRALEKAGPRGAHLAALLSAEVGEMAARTRETGAEWRMLPLPWNAGGQIERVALIARRESPDEESDDKKKGGKGAGTRFLVNVTLSRLGELQLDGMFRKQERAFDMVLRTKTPWPEDMRRDLTGLFAASNAAMGLKGGLTFQVARKFADPIAEGQPLAQDKSGLWV